MKDLIKYIGASIVDHPDDVEVAAHDNGDTDVYELSVNNDDLGQVIGRQGRTARAIRTIARAAAAKNERRAQVEIVE